MRLGKGQKVPTIWVVALALGWAMVPAAQAQSSQGQSQPSQAQPNQPQHPSQDIPDAPSVVQPPTTKFPTRSTEELPSRQETEQQQDQDQQPSGAENNSSSSSSSSTSSQQTQDKQTPPPMPPVETVPAGTPLPPNTQARSPRNQINPAEDLYKIQVTTNFVQVPVTVKDSRGRRVEGLLPKDFVVRENGVPQVLTYFTSDPFLLSAAIVLDTGMADVALQKVNQTYSSLVGAFSPYDEVALYTYSSTVSQVADFTNRAPRLTAALDQMKLVRGGSSGPPVLGGPFGPQPPTINGMPVGTAGPPPVITPPKESHVLNDAILRAALDLSKRDRQRRKVIVVISDGRERGSEASFRQVLKVLQTHGIQVKAVVLDMGALPGYKQVEKIHHLLWQGYSDILPKYTSATGGGSILTELTRNSIEVAYNEITSDARNQYTLGYSPKAVKGGSPYRSIEVLVDQRNLKVYAKDGYYPFPAPR